jgi:hypothetical protein
MSDIRGKFKENPKDGKNIFVSQKSGLKKQYEISSGRA